MSQDNFSFINRAVDIIYSTGSNEQAREVLKSMAPQYDATDTTLASQYDTKFKNDHSDRGIPNIGNFCLDKPEKKVIRDLPFTPPKEVVLKNIPPTPEAPFVRPTGEAEENTFECIPCDSRVSTLVSGHYAYVKRDTEANEFFSNPQTFKGTLPEHNHYVNQPNVNTRSNSNSVGSDDGTPVVEGRVLPTLESQEEPLPQV